MRSRYLPATACQLVRVSINELGYEGTYCFTLTVSRGASEAASIGAREQSRLLR